MQVRVRAGPRSFDAATGRLSRDGWTAVKKRETSFPSWDPKVPTAARQTRKQHKLDRIPLAFGSAAGH